MQKKLIIFTLVSAFVFSAASFLLPDIAHACSCAAGTSQEEDFENAQAVFVGRVLSTDTHKGALRDILGDTPSHRNVEFWVTERWKGVNENPVTVATGFGGGDCGFYFAEGERYLVYAHDGDFYGTDLSTGICTRTEVLRHSNEEVALLGPGDTSFTDAEIVYYPFRESWWNGIQNRIAEFFIEPITRTIFVAPWYVALSIIALYLTPPVALLYWLIRRRRK